MSKNIPITLLGHFEEEVQTTGYLMKIGPTRSGLTIRITSMDRDFVYDDGMGDGPQTFYTKTGAEISNLSSGEDLAVNNGEAKSLIEQYPGQGVNEAMVDNGELTGVEYYILKVNRRDTSMGHEWMASGPIGEVRVDRNGMVLLELRSWSDYLRQNSVVERDSLTCRARFGSRPIGTGGGVDEQLYPCNYDTDPEWVYDCVVTAQGPETVREFTAAGLEQESGFFGPGLVYFTSGANEGMYREVEWFDAGGVITLMFTARHPVQVGDTFNIRRDCTHNWAGHNSCETYNNRQWFRGEPFIPVADVLALTAPGAAFGGFQ